MSATIIDGKAIAQDLRAKIAAAAADLKTKHGIVPGLAVVLAGNDPASEVYVRSKSKAVIDGACDLSITSCRRTSRKTSSCGLLRKLNADDSVHGILVQLPLPKQIDAAAVLNAIDPAKDVDGFHPVNVGRLSTGLPALVPCTPVGSVRLAKSIRGSLAGLDAVVLGRSNIVGKPLAQLLLAENATVTIAHSKTKDLAGCLPPRRSTFCSSRAAGNGARQLDQTGRDRDRCRHQPRAGRRRKNETCRGRRVQ